MPITPIFAALFTLIFIVLSISVIRHRFSKKISRGGGGDRDLEIAVRIHANFAEYVPLALILFWCIEQVTFNSRLVFILGCVLLVSRFAHVIGMRDPRNFMVFRQIGMLGTFAVLAVGSVSLLWHYLPI